MNTGFSTPDVLMASVRVREAVGSDRGPGVIPDRLTGLQWARAIAAVAVVVTHAVAHPFPSAPGVFHLLGRFGVALFFVISGFIMVSTTYKGSFDPVAFMVRRIKRIAPLYYIATFSLLSISLLSPSLLKATRFELDYFVKSLLFIPAYRPGSGYSIEPFLKLGWTLNYEMFFYLVFSTCFALSARSRVYVVTGVLLALVVSGQLIVFEEPILVFFTRVDLIGFVAGMWLALWTQGTTNRLTFNANSMIILGSLSSLAIMAFKYSDLKLLDSTQLWLVITCVAIAYLFVNYRPAQPFKKLDRAMIFIGDASYSIYLFHIFAVAAVMLLLKNSLSSGLLYVAMALAFIFGLLAGIVAYVYLERKLLSRI